MIEIIFSLHPESDEGTRDMASPLRSTLRTRALNSLEQFGALVQRLIEQSLELSPAELIDLSLELSGYARLLNEDREHGDERWENVRELRGSAEQYDGDDSRAQLAEFLESVALVSDVDLLDEAGDTEAITLITLHQAKGLEFDAVFMIGLEEGLLPHSRSIDDPEQLEEERRLCYVGMTRARKHLYMLRAFQRSFRGSRGASVPSRFVGEMPQDLVSNHLTRRASRRSSTMVGDPLAVKHAAASPGPPSGSGARVEYKAADKVCHSHFGEGVVVNAIDAHGDIEVTVAFGGGHGVKRLMLSLANLERVAPEPTPAHDDKLDSVLDIP
jgi:DNA helicase-2/ATP-dependent DNA helicase PcrA